MDPDRQNLGQSSKLSFFIIYKFWQNCALVWQVSDLILKTHIFLPWVDYGMSFISMLEAIDKVAQGLCTDALGKGVDIPRPLHTGMASDTDLLLSRGSVKLDN